MKDNLQAKQYDTVDVESKSALENQDQGVLKEKNYVQKGHVENYDCNKCDKNFVSIHGLNLHITSIHEKVKKHKCECGQLFSQSASLKR